MWNNIGGKIKGLIKILFWVSSAIFVIGGIVLMAIDEDLILYGLLCVFIGPLLTWISSFLVYGFGELVENSAILTKNSNTDSKQNTLDENSEKKKKLKSLYSKGQITEEEYNTALTKL